MSTPKTQYMGLSLCCMSQTLLRDAGDDECNTSSTNSQKFRKVVPSMRNPASKDINSRTLCKTAVCFSHLELMGTTARLPEMHKVPPAVDFESSRDLRANLSLETIPVSTVLQCFKSENRVVNMRNQTNEASVTSSCPCRDCSCQFVHKPQKIKTADARQNESISRRFETKRLTVLSPFPLPLP